MLINYNATCPLCLSPAKEFFTCKRELKTYHHCDLCDLRFLNPIHQLSLELESKHYSLHQNVATDLHYQEFFRPLIYAVKPRLIPGAKGLDYGCGVDSALAFLLRNAGFDIALYDPLYFPNPESLETKYDFIVCTETAEHFYDPRRDFTRLHGLLKENAILAVMTLLVPTKIDFQNWYYRQDPTHVSFYSEETFYWLANFLGLAEAKIINSRLILLQS
ncbi:MAG: class I SAM-dependent methyltransferase [Oligoflexales bacterium]|nr:class I SAM-dependent methyltransferase [Oligoflexales bacterium]